MGQYNEYHNLANLPIMWIMKEANTTAQPQPPSGGVTELEEGMAPPSPSPPAAPSFTSLTVGDFSLGGEALTGMSLASPGCQEAVTGSRLSGPAMAGSRGGWCWSLGTTRPRLDPAMERC